VDSNHGEARPASLATGAPKDLGAAAAHVARYQRAGSRATRFLRRI
jgi:hypothetical protein